MKPTLRFIVFLLTLLLVLRFNVATEVKDELEELLAVDEEVEREAEKGGEKLSEAEVLSKAQRIVIELKNENTERVVNGNEFVLVLGYAPWCPRSAELMPHFAEAATSLKELGSPLIMAKLDADRYPKPASFLGVKGFPTLLLFVNGTSQPYSGGFTADDIVIWAQKKTSTPVIRISSVAEAEKFLTKYQTFLIGRFENFEVCWGYQTRGSKLTGGVDLWELWSCSINVGPDYEEFVSAAKSDNEIQFVETSQVELAQVLYPDIKPTDRFLGIVKSEPERYSAYDYNKFPLVTKLTEMNSVRVYSSPIKLQVLVFANIDDFKNLLDTLQDVAKTFKSKIMFIYVDINDENLAKPFLTLFGLEESKNTVEFCNNLMQGSLSPYFKSQPIPDNTEASVRAIVGKTFDDEILSSKKDVLLEVFTPWCMNCEATSKQVEKLAKHYKGSSNLIFARTDASANEHPKLQVNDYPTLLFYRADDKANPIKLSTKSSLKELAASINKYLKVKNQVLKDEL
ncbi:Protein disulfide isomerase-like 1-6 [Glycine max]|nr:Protein disulfide isomerase-like 1-6 [Glycine max]